MPHLGNQIVEAARGIKGTGVDQSVEQISAPGESVSQRRRMHQDRQQQAEQARLRFEQAEEIDRARQPFDQRRE